MLTPHEHHCDTMLSKTKAEEEPPCRPHRGALTCVLTFLWKSRFLAAGALLACLGMSVFADARQNDTELRLPIVQGSDMRFTHVSFGEGPSHDRVSDIIEDNQGFLWFGTQDGLRRYDGYRTREYRHDPNNPNSLGGNFILDMFKDHSGKIWVASSEYLDRFDPATEIFTHYQGTSFNGQIVDINQDHDGTMWLATYATGLIKLDPVTGAITHFHHIAGDTASLSSDGLSSTFEQKDGTFWVATAAGLDIFNRKTGKVTQHVPFPRPFATQTPGPIRLHEDHAGVLWVVLPTGSGLAVVDRRAGKFFYYASTLTTSGNTLFTGVRTIREDEDGTLWLGTQSRGLLKLDRQRKVFVQYRNNPNDPSSISADRVDSLYEDHEGGLWEGTTGGGVNRSAIHPLPFQRYRFEHWNRHGSDLNVLSTVFDDSRGFLWIATIGALERIDRKTGQSMTYRMAGGPGITNAYVTSIAEDHSGQLWFGTRGGGLHRYDARNGTFKVYRHNAADPHGLPSDAVGAILVDRKGTLWVSTENGVATLDQRTGHFRTYRFGEEKQSFYEAIAEGSDGAIWLGTWGTGLQRLDPESGQFTVYRQDSKKPGSLSSNTVLALCVDHFGILWIATSDGLNRFNPATQTFTVYDERDGLPSSNVNGILEDEAGNLWLSTNNGLSRFDPRAKTFKNYSTSDGLPANEFYGGNAGFKSRTGEMFFCSRSGLTTFFPDKVVDNPYVPPVVLTDFQLFNKHVPVGGNSLLKQSISETKALTLNHAQNVFSFEFSALSFASPQKNRYRYRLEGLENQWNETDSSRRFVTYTTLAPKEYIFRVQGSNNRGVWNEQGVSVRIRILPPWWGTWWFRVIVGASLLLSLWCVYYLRLKGVERRQAEIRALNEQLIKGQEAERMRVAGELHDGVLQQITSLSLRLGKMRYQVPPDSEAKATVSGLQQQLIQIGTDIRHLSHELHPALLQESGLPAALSAYCEEFSKVRGLPVSCKADQSVQELSPGAALCLYRIAQEALGNAAKYSDAKKVEVRLTRANGTVCLSVSDDGVGCTPDVLRRSGGLGVINMRERVLQLRGTFEFDSQPGRGTTVKAEVPFRPAP